MTQRSHGWALINLTGVFIRGDEDQAPWLPPVIPTLGGQGRRIAGGQEFETNLSITARPCLNKKINKQEEEMRTQAHRGETM